MGLFDSLKKLGEAVEVLNEAANTASKTTIEDFGEPVYSLYTALELGDLHRRIDITDEEGNVKYYTKSSVIALTGKPRFWMRQVIILHILKKGLSASTKSTLLPWQTAGISHCPMKYSIS
jgi:hypothetical protein